MIFEPGNENYTTCSTLGRCFYDKGTVLLAKHIRSGNLVAIKHFNLEDIMHEEYQAVLEEVIRMRQLKHANIIGCLTSYVVNFDLYIISPLMGYGSCHDLISAHFHDGMPELVICFILRDILEALDYIHSKGYIHRAVKARHIFLKSDGHACLSGLRYMYFRDSRTDSVHDFPLLATHNLNWLSPEVLEQNTNGYDEKSDIYSVGITGCELANGIVPFSETSTTLMLTEKYRGLSPQLLDRTTWLAYEECNKEVENSVVPKKYANRNFTESFHTFVELCSHRNVNIRPLPKQLLNHSFFKPLRRQKFNIPFLLQPAVAYTETNTTELNIDLDSIDDLTKQIKNVDIYHNDWDF